MFSAATNKIHLRCFEQDGLFARSSNAFPEYDHGLSHRRRPALLCSPPRSAKDPFQKTGNGSSTSASLQLYQSCRGRLGTCHLANEPRLRFASYDSHAYGQYRPRKHVSHSLRSGVHQWVPFHLHRVIRVVRCPRMSGSTYNHKLATNKMDPGSLDPVQGILPAWKSLEGRLRKGPGFVMASDVHAWKLPAETSTCLGQVSINAKFDSQVGNPVSRHFVAVHQLWNTF